MHWWWCYIRTRGRRRIWAENHYCLLRWCFGEMRNLLHICSLCLSVIVFLEDIVIVGRWRQQIFALCLEARSMFKKKKTLFFKSRDEEHNENHDGKNFGTFGLDVVLSGSVLSRQPYSSSLAIRCDRLNILIPLLHNEASCWFISFN